ncbi:MAG TPA: UDP-N-acetylmuramate dehydrogenase [Longimicrobiales bacterium]
MPKTAIRAAELEKKLPGVERNVILAPYTTFQIGGPADYFYHARTADGLIKAISTARELDIPYFLLGLGANILVGDKGFRGLVVHSEVGGIDFLDDTRVRAGSGVLVFHDLINATVKRGLGGLHHYVGIPSTVGGAIWQNLHFLSPPPERERTCFIAEVLESCTILTQEGEVRDVDNGYFNFGYDYSILHDRDDVVLTATFQLQPQPEEELRYVMRENLQWRDERHPDLWLYPCAGSIFQKIKDVGAGRLIDQCGLKGYVYGNAGIFQRHANIIVNYGGATAAEVRHIIELARSTVQKELGYELKTEIGMIGEF